jgi:hypothetical protein
MKLSYCLIDDFGKDGDYITCQAGDSFTITSDMRFKMSATRQTYDVIFVVGDTYGKPVDAQRVTYLHYATEPDPQFDDSYIIAGWYKDADFKEEFDFKTMPIEQDTVLYARWLEYHDPTKLSIAVDNDEQLVKVTLGMSVGADIRVSFGDETKEEKFVAAEDGLATVSHNYATAGEYVIEVRSLSGRYFLGGNDLNPCVLPISILKKIEFA